MKTTARVIVTKQCNRKCIGCCNESLGDIRKVQYEELLTYKEIIITGGEPMLIAEKVCNFIDKLSSDGYNGKIYLYTASYYMPFECFDLLQKVDGITYTVHYPVTSSDISMLKLIQLELHKRKEYSSRISIDSRIDKELTDVFEPELWDDVRHLEWKDDCPLPANEKLFLFEL